MEPTGMLGSNMHGSGIRMFGSGGSDPFSNGML